MPLILNVTVRGGAFKSTETYQLPPLLEHLARFAFVTTSRDCVGALSWGSLRSYTQAYRYQRFGFVAARSGEGCNRKSGLSNDDGR